MREGERARAAQPLEKFARPSAHGVLDPKPLANLAF